MSWEELRRITPRHFSRLVEEYQAAQASRERMGEFMMAQIVAMVANTGFRSFKEWREPKEFMPSLRSGSERQRSRRRCAKVINREIEFAMESAVRYQNAQVRGGVT